MGELLVVAFLGGLITGISPCIVPVIPVVVAGGSSTTSRRRPFLIIGGLVLSFSLTVLFAQTVLSFLHLPLDFLFWLGVAMLGAICARADDPANRRDCSSGRSRGLAPRVTPTREAGSSWG